MISRFWHLTLRPEEADPNDPAAALVDAEYCLGDVSVLALFRGKLIVRRLEVDGIDVVIDRAADGTFPAFQALLQSLNESPGEEEAPTDDAAAANVAQEFNLSAPLELTALRLQHCHVTIRDASSSRPRQRPVSILTCVFRISDLEARRTRFRMTLSSPKVFGNISFEGDGKAADNKLDAKFRVLGQDLRPSERAVYLHQLGLESLADSFSFELDGHVELAVVPRPDALKPNAPGDGGGGGEEATPPSSPAADDDVETPKVLAGRFELASGAFNADGEEHMALDSASIEIRTLTPAELRVGQVSVRGGRALARRLASGMPAFAGLVLRQTDSGGAEPPEAPAPAEPVESEPANAVPGGTTTESVSPSVATAPPAPSELFRWQVDDVQVVDCSATLADATVSADHRQSFDLQALSVRGLTNTPGAPPVEALAQFAAPGLVERIDVKASVQALTPEKTASVSFAASGITAHAAAPYLKVFGLESLLSAARASAVVDCKLTGGGGSPLGAEFSMRDVLFSDGAELFGLEGVRVSGVQLDSAGERVVIDQVEVRGPALGFAREADGALHALGVRWSPPSAAPASPSSPATSESSDGTASNAEAVAAPIDLAGIPVIELKKLSWQSGALSFRDRAVEPEVAVDIPDAGFELENLIIDFGAQEGQPASLRGWLAAPGLGETLKLEGTLVPSAQGVTSQLNVSGEGLNGTALRPYLENFGIDATFARAQFGAQFGADIDVSNDGVAASLRCENLALLDDDGLEQIAVDNVAIEAARPGPAGLTVGRVLIDRPRLRLRRSETGEFSAAGVRALLQEVNAASDAATETATATTASSDTEASPPPASAAPFEFALEQLQIRGAELHWQDDFVSPPVSVALLAEASLDGFSLSPEGDAARLSAALRVPEILERATASGTVSVTPTEQRLQLDLSAQGLAAGSLAAYLPEGIECSLTDGRAAARIEARVAQLEAGGLAARLDVREVEYRDGEAAPYLKIASVRVDVPRFDPTSDVEVRELSVAGVEARCARADDGSIEAAGIVIRPTAAPSDTGDPISEDPVSGDPSPGDSPGASSAGTAGVPGDDPAASAISDAVAGGGT